MMTKRKVLIPLDGSEFSRQVVRVVREFFAHEDVMLVLFRVATSPIPPTEVVPHDVFVGGMSMTGAYDLYNRPVESGYDSFDRERDLLRAELQDALRVEADLMREDGYTVAIEVRFGDPAQAIIDYVNESDIALVAMATHGRSGLGRIVLGSVAERVLRGVGVPVLLMRSAPDSAQISTPGELLAKSLGNGGKLNIAAATDGSKYGNRAVEMAADLSTVLDADLTLLVSIDERKGPEYGHRVMEDACKLVRHLDPRPEAEPLVGYADEEVLRYVATNPVDLLVIGAFEDRGAGPSTAIGPTAQRVVQHASTSVLLVKGRKTGFRRILACAALDDAVTVEVAAEIAHALGAQLELLHVVPTSAASYLASSDADSIPVEDVIAQGSRLSTVTRSWINSLAKQGYDRDAIVVRRGNVPETILDYVHQGNYDLVIAGSQSGAGHFLGSVANAVIRFAEQSVLIVRTRSG